MYKGALLFFENEFGIAVDQEAYCMNANGKEWKTTGVNVEYYGKIKLRQAIKVPRFKTETSRIKILRARYFYGMCNVLFFVDTHTHTQCTYTLKLRGVRTTPVAVEK